MIAIFRESEDKKSIASSVHDFFQTFTENYENYGNLHLISTDLIEFNYRNVKYLYNTFFGSSSFLARYKNKMLSF